MRSSKKREIWLIDRGRSAMKSWTWKLEPARWNQIRAPDKKCHGCQFLTVQFLRTDRDVSCASHDNNFMFIIKSVRLNVVKWEKAAVRKWTQKVETIPKSERMRQSVDTSFNKRNKTKRESLWWESEHYLRCKNGRVIMISMVIWARSAGRSEFFLPPIRRWNQVPLNFWSYNI
jgi:hypothetical protein